MLDLQPRVHLHEVEAIGTQALAGVDDELDRSGSDITNRARSFDGRGSHGAPHLLRHARRRGLGRKLVARFLYQAQLRGADSAFLEVSAENAAAIALYESAGFTPSGRRSGYYRAPDGTRVDALVMHRELAGAAGR